MHFPIHIQQNSYGFTKGSRGGVAFTDSGIIVKGDGLQAQSKTIQHCLQAMYICGGFAVFIVIQWFHTYLLIGDRRSWLWSIGWRGEDTELLDLIFGFLLIVVLPFAGAFWLSNKAVHPFRLRFSIPKKHVIPYEELTCFKLTSGSEMELLAASKNNAKNKIILTCYDIALPLILLSKITSDYEELAKVVGGEIDRKNNENCLKLKFFNQGVYIGSHQIDGLGYDAVKKTLIINYLLYFWFAQKNNTPLVVGKNYVPMQTLFNSDSDSFDEDVKSLAPQFDRNPTQMENVIKSIGGKLSSEIDDVKTYLINALPNVPLRLEVEKKWTGKYKCTPFFEKNCSTFFGEEFMRDICWTFMNYLKV